MYYQCYTHQKLGWRLVKEGSDEAMAAVAASGNAQLMSEMTVEAPAATVTEANPACAAGLLSVAGMPTQFECGLDISGVGKLVWTHDAAANSVTFGAEMPTTGWIGIGFNTPQSVSRMPGSVVGAANTLSSPSLTIVLMRTLPLTGPKWPRHPCPYLFEAIHRTMDCVLVLSIHCPRMAMSLCPFDVCTKWHFIYGQSSISLRSAL